MFSLKIHEQMLFALLRASLNRTPADVCCFQDVSEEEWTKCYQLAKKQGVMALAWDGAMLLPAGLQPPVELKILWAVAVEKYEKKYTRYCRTIDELAALYAKEGISIVQMKGVGLSTYYPIPSHREGGDIDIFTFSTDKSGMTDEEASRLADELMERQGIEVEMHSYKHSFFYYKGIPIENHKVFLNVKYHPVIAQANKLLKECLAPEVATLLDGTCKICIPSSAFNTIFLAIHTLQHYGSGISLHHLCDWAVLINRFGLVFPDELKDKRFLNAVAAITYLCNRYLGTSIKIADGEEMAEEMLKEILYPQYPHKAKVPISGRWNILIYKTRRFLYMARTKNKIFYRPLWKWVWISVWAHICRPKTIFRT